MALVKMKTLLENAAKNNRGCGAFQCGQYGDGKGLSAQQRRANTPIILQIAEVRLNIPLT